MVIKEGTSVDTERLYAASAHHTRAANSKVSSKDRHVQMEAAIHAGAAVELMAKAILATADQRLLLDKIDGHSLLIDMLIKSEAVVAQQASAKRDVARTVSKTLSAGRALELSIRLHPSLGAHLAAGQRALAARNAAAHSAEITVDALQAQVTSASDFVLACVASLGKSSGEFLGTELVDRVKHEVAKRSEDLVVTAQRLVDESHRRYEDFIAKLVEGNDQDVLRQLAKQGASHGDHAERYGCPACSNMGWLMWNVDIEVEYEGPGEYSTSASMDFIGFACPFCFLELDAEQSDAIGIDHSHDSNSGYEQL
jgi:hypothetical protein